MAGSLRFPTQMSLRLLRDAGLGDIQREMSRMFHESGLDPTVRRLAERAIDNYPDHIGAIYDFVKQTFPYAPDPIENELFIHPRVVATDYYAGRFRAADCDDHALLNAALLSSIGYKVRIALLAMKGAEIDHAVAQVWTELGWLSVDTTSSRSLGWVETYNYCLLVE